MAHTNISWATDVWNPMTGCTPISEGCQNCYAKRMARRLHGRCGYPDFPNEFSVTFHPDRLDLPMKWKKPRRIFVNSMGDIFHDDVNTDWIDDVLEVIVACPQHVFMMLTKRPENLYCKFYEIVGAPGCRKMGGWDYIPNLWLGVTAENQARADERIPVLLSIPAAVHFVSVEPCFGPVDIAKYLGSRLKWPYPFVVPADAPVPRGLNWCICGPETGPGARPCKAEWIEDLQDQCQLQSVPFFDKREDYLERRRPNNGNERQA